MEMDLCHKIQKLIIHVSVNDHPLYAFLFSITQYMDMSKPHSVSIQTTIWPM